MVFGGRGESGAGGRWVSVDSGGRGWDKFAFLLVSEVPEVYRKLRETCGKNSRYVSSKSKLMLSSYDKRTQTLTVKQAATALA